MKKNDRNGKEMKGGWTIIHWGSTIIQIMIGRSRDRISRFQDRIFRSRHPVSRSWHSVCTAGDVTSLSSQMLAVLHQTPYIKHSTSKFQIQAPYIKHTTSKFLLSDSEGLHLRGSLGTERELQLSVIVWIVQHGCHAGHLDFYQVSRRN